ncbi:MAG: ferredoxin [Actinomycetota bacterium]
MKVGIDSTRCQGHARCHDTAPEVFSLDEMGFSYLENSDVDPSLEGKVQAAIASCPERAISVIEE